MALKAEIIPRAMVWSNEIGPNQIKVARCFMGPEDMDT
jgi:hypothetical protein